MVRFVKKYLVLMVVAVLFVGAFLLNLKTNAAKTGSGEGEALQPPEEAQEAEYVPGDYFATFRDDREQVRKLEMEYLDEVIAASASDDETLGAEANVGGKHGKGIYRGEPDQGKGL